MKLKLLISLLSVILLLISIDIKAQEPEGEDFSVILQKKAIDCGPVCLQMIAQFHGRMWKLKTLSTYAKMDSSGTTLLGISEAADTIGLKNVGIRTTYNNLLQEAPLPFMVHWNNNHFVVVYKITDKNVWVADPAIGKVKYTKKEFCKHWLTSLEEPNKGVAMLFETKDDFFEVNNQIPVNPNKYNKSLEADLLVKSKKGPKLGLWINSSVWKALGRPLNENFELTFTAKEGQIYAAFAVDTTQIPLELLKTQTHLTNLKIDPKAKILKEEYRMVNGLKVLFVKRQAVLEASEFVFLDYYFSGKYGTIQVVTFSTKAFINQYQDFCEKLMNGLVELK
ncbi:hypothetical protein BKI52_40010 [marine bacterium AO1-C]|nr:hypothetical protein BKI52_40010 [marine bacterium AO1-C]